MIRSLLAEFFGTFFLLLAIGFTQDPFLISLSLALLIYLGFKLSGAQYNPAVSLAIILRGKMKVVPALLFCTAQFMGALAGSFLVYLVNGKTFSPQPAPDISLGKALVAEIIGTFLMVTVILHVATAERTKGNYYYGVAIAASVLISILIFGSWSGSALNPAVGLAPAFVEFMLGNHPSLQYFWLYLVGPVLGSIAATGLFRVTNRTDHE